MKKLLLSLALAFVGGGAVAAESDAERKKDIARHRAMSAAHEAAARCLDSGKSHEVCEKELTAACKGIAIGKYCGMRHAH
ncbi:MAG: hypothetical protein EOO25_08135 [Comamonadaceae bacterium]|nr:MAG: hypothetical protein EOO25_08135 [Comamonadaceae bacterium]